MLTGCTATPERPLRTVDMAWGERQQQLNQLQLWQIEGRIALRNGEEGGQSGFHWEYQTERQRFVLSGLLGMGGVELVVNPAVTQLTTPEGVFQGGTASALLTGVTGWTFPLEEAIFWVKGLPAEGVAIDSLLLDEHNRLQHLQQSGWSLEIRRYRQQGDLQLPELLVLEREQIRIKLKINRWQVNHEKGE